jgi:hypothetical protein
MYTPQHLDPARVWTADAEQSAPIAELNAEIVERHLSAVPLLRDQWHSLPASARERIAHCPFLLADAGFARAQLWAGLAGGGVHEQVPHAAPSAEANALSTPVLRRVLLLAWHMARSNRAGARVALGMSGACASVVAACRLADLEALAERRPSWIRPRWAQHTAVWRAWLHAAALECPRELERLQLWGLQMLATEIRRRPE